MRFAKKSDEVVYNTAASAAITWGNDWDAPKICAVLCAVWRQNQRRDAKIPRKTVKKLGKLAQFLAQRHIRWMHYAPATRTLDCGYAGRFPIAPPHLDHFVVLLPSRFGDRYWLSFWIVLHAG